MVTFFGYICTLHHHLADSSVSEDSLVTTAGLGANRHNLGEMLAQGHHTGSQLINDIALDAYCLHLMDQNLLSQGVCLSCRLVLCGM